MDENQPLSVDDYSKRLEQERLEAKRVFFEKIKREIPPGVVHFFLEWQYDDGAILQSCFHFNAQKGNCKHAE